MQLSGKVGTEWFTATFDAQVVGRLSQASQ